MRVLVCGGRDYLNKEKFNWELQKALYEQGWHHPKDPYTPHRDVIIISGMAKGADTLAVYFANNNKLELLEFPADWDTHGKAAGHIRNQQMIDEGHPDLVVAFPTKNSRGTYDMIRRAEKHNIKTIVVKPDDA